MAAARDLKFRDFESCGFESHYPHLVNLVELVYTTALEAVAARYVSSTLTVGINLIGSIKVAP